MKRRNFISLAIITVLVVAIIGGTMAWFTDQAETENVFSAGTVDIDVEGAVELGESTLQNWNPGDTNLIEYTFTNNGTKNLRFRVGFTGLWEDQLSTDNVGLVDMDDEVWFLGWLLGDYEDPITWELNEDWTFENGYLYYNGILAPEGSVDLVLTIKLDGPTTGNAYQGKSFSLNGLVQAIQASHDDEWEWDEVDFVTGLELP